MYVTKEVKEQIKQLAKLRNSTMTELIQELLSEEIENADLADYNAAGKAKMLANLEPTEEKLKQKSKGKKSKQNWWKTWSYWR